MIKKVFSNAISPIRDVEDSSCSDPSAPAADERGRGATHLLKAQLAECSASCSHITECHSSKFPQRAFSPGEHREEDLPPAPRPRPHSHPRPGSSSGRAPAVPTARPRVATRPSRRPRDKLSRYEATRFVLEL